MLEMMRMIIMTVFDQLNFYPTMETFRAHQTGNAGKLRAGAGRSRGKTGV